MFESSHRANLIWPLIKKKQKIIFIWKKYLDGRFFITASTVYGIRSKQV